MRPDYAAGDTVVCIDAAPRAGADVKVIDGLRQLRLGASYTVRRVFESVGGHWGVLLDGADADVDRGYHADRFAKARKPAGRVGRPAKAETEASIATLYGALLRAADRGERCPTNEVICGLIGATSVSAPPRLMGIMERRGMIRVERGQRDRIVHIVATGKRTAGKIGAKHWRDREPTELKPKPMVAPPAPELLAAARKAVQVADEDLADLIEIEAIRTGTPQDAFLSRLLWLGWHCHLDDMAAEKAAA